MKPSIFFDMDGLIADFTGAAMSLHGWTLPPTEIRWDFMTRFGMSETDSRFWNPLGYEFWRSIPPLTDGFGLLARVESLVGKERIGILTRPCDTHGCYDGKRQWISDHLPGYKKRFFAGYEKSLFAGPGKILIDDHDPNVSLFISDGGNAVLVPRAWNARRGEICGEGFFDPDKIFNEIKIAIGA
jgi:hypothetical protein